MGKEMVTRQRFRDLHGRSIRQSIGCGKRNVKTLRKAAMDHWYCFGGLGQQDGPVPFIYAPLRQHLRSAILPVVAQSNATLLVEHAVTKIPSSSAITYVASASGGICQQCSEIRF